MSLTKVLSQRKATTPEIERENFERAQSVSLAKAINSQETPVKEKHVRNAIIGSFQEKGAHTFWNVVLRLNLQGNPIVCWKFCHVLHKLLREGHPRSIEDSLRNTQFLGELQKLWGLLRDGYGKLIGCYCKLLVAKMDFHRRNPRFPGNLQISDEKLEEIAERDVNVYFQMSCEMFDYMDEILSLQTAVYGSLDMSRSNSMTTSGQCRLAPLIPCIQDSSHLYDFTVKLLFKLHSSLPADTLGGHRDRFLKQYKLLQQFYLSSSNLQYFKYLIQVPLLPEYPPNFLISSDLKSHISPVVILHEPDVADGPDNDPIDMNLVDVTSASANFVKFDDSFGTEDDVSSITSHVSEQLLEKDRIIHQLVKELEQLRLEMQRLKINYERKVDDFKRQLSSDESQFAQYDRTIQLLKEEIEELKKDKETTTINENGESSKLVEKAKAQEEKFIKMKDIYSKLREEHIGLIRTKADLEKQTNAGKTTIGELKQNVQEIQNQLKMAEIENKIVCEKLQNSGQDNETFVLAFKDEIGSLKDENKELLKTFEDLKDKLLTAENSLKEMTKIKMELEDKFRVEKMDYETSKTNFEQILNDFKWNLLYGNLIEAESILKSTLNEFENPGISMVNCTPEYLLTQLDSLKEASEIMRRKHELYTEDSSSNIEDFARNILPFSHKMAVILLHAKTTSQSTPNIEQGDELATNSKEFGKIALQFFSQLKTKESSSESIKDLFLKLQDLNTITEKLITNVSLESPEKLVDMVREELSEMDKAIEEATERIAAMLTKSKEGDSGIKLEVNGKILDACTTLMEAIKILVQRSRDLQEEITSQAKGTASITEFYNRNHRWTEGLISAAKVVGMSAKFMVDAADKVVLGNAKFVELVVASQEIAAATAQLVVASKVKAERGSTRMSELSKASRNVTDRTGNVVATAKSCAQLVEESQNLDFSKLSLHQAKLMEMESQVRVLELENNLEKERIKLLELRKKHYHLAGPSEGWEEESRVNGQ